MARNNKALWMVIVRVSWGLAGGWTPWRDVRTIDVARKMVNEEPQGTTLAMGLDYNNPENVKRATNIKTLLPVIESVIRTHVKQMGGPKKMSYKFVYATEAEKKRVARGEYW